MITISIDGLSGSGKSSLSRNLAKLLDFQHIDVDLIFKALAYTSIVKNYKQENIINFLREKEIDLKIRKNRIFIDDMDVTNRLNDQETAILSATFYDNEEAKRAVRRIEKELSKRENTIFSGRSEGERVFPESDLKFFIIAPLEKRAQRKLLEYISSVNKLTYERIFNELKDKDERDKEKGNIVIDESTIRIDNSEDDMLKTLEMMLDTIRIKINK